MARLSVEQQVDRIHQTIRSWEKHAPDRTFSGYTLAEFKAAMQPSLDAHARVVDLREDVRIALLERNGLLGKALQSVYLVGFAVRGDPEHGPNSALNESLGYTREVVRRAKIRRGKRRK